MMDVLSTNGTQMMMYVERPQPGVMREDENDDATPSGRFIATCSSEFRAGVNYAVRRNKIYFFERIKENIFYE